MRTVNSNCSSAARSVLVASVCCCTAVEALITRACEMWLDAFEPLLLGYPTGLHRSIGIQVLRHLTVRFVGCPAMALQLPLATVAGPAAARRRRAASRPHRAHIRLMASPGISTRVMRSASSSARQESLLRATASMTLRFESEIEAAKP